MFLKIQKATSKAISLINIPKENLSLLAHTELILDPINFNTIKINIIDDCLKYIAIPACSDKELYFYETESEIIFSDCIYEVSQQMGQIQENKSATDFFLDMSYTPAGETQIDRLMRLIPSRIYRLQDGIFYNDKIKYDSAICYKEKSDYSNFLSCLKKICLKESKLGKVGVFFSGGVDSLTLALILESLAIPFTLYTGKMVQGLDDNEKDVLRSISIAKERNWELKIINVDYNEYEFKNLHEIIDLMPTTSHLSALFLEIAKSMNKDDIKVCFSGQNVDILYNFEATTSLALNRGAFVNFARRFFMSEIYFSSLNSKPYKHILVSIVANLFLLGYCLMRKSFDFKLPKNKEELFYNYTHNPDLTVFSSKIDNNKIDEFSYIFEDGEGLRSALIRSRIEESLTSGAPMSIINAGIINNVKVILPYSSELLIPFFMNLKTSVKDIFYPKNIIHKFVNTNIKKISHHNHKPKNNLPDYHTWVNQVFTKTNLGKSLATLDSKLIPDTSTSALKLSYQLSYSWKNYLMKSIDKRKNEQ
jgi:hypothetical protein